MCTYPPKRAAWINGVSEGRKFCSTHRKSNLMDTMPLLSVVFWLFLDFGRSMVIQAASETVGSRVRLADQSTHHLYDIPDSVKNVFIGTGPGHPLRMSKVNELD